MKKMLCLVGEGNTILVFHAWRSTRRISKIMIKEVISKSLWWRMPTTKRKEIVEKNIYLFTSITLSCRN
jgi:hypothetical protein